jgi:two-component system sensor histidine kinase KdpD
MDVRRPDPDLLLARVVAEEAEQQHGKLKVFLGAAPGVGKTYAMLNAARELSKQGVDIVVGVVETHGRKETEALLAGLEVLPRQRIEYRGRAREEMDLDALLRRRPTLALVDELAHSNVPGARHDRRYQDIDELLDAGIDVYTTINVQHLESLNDVVEQITQVRVRETVPDAFLDRLHDIVLIDLPPRELIDRLRQGKVYMQERAQAALDRFFSPTNLAALRELAIQTVANRVDADLRDDLAANSAAGGASLRRRVLVAVDGHEYTEYLIRVARRFAERRQAPWTVAHVDTGDSSRTDGDKLQAALQLAQRLGGSTVLLRGPSVADELLSYAGRHGVSSIMIGRTRERALARVFNRTITQQLLNRGARFELTIVNSPLARIGSRRRLAGDFPWSERLREYALATAVSAVAVVLCAGLERWLPLASLALVFLCAVLVVAVSARTSVSIYTALLCFLAYNFFFTEPRLSLRISSAADVVPVMAFLAAALVCGQLAAQQYAQVVMLRAANEHARVLLALGERLAGAVDEFQVFQAGCEAHAMALECDVVMLRRDSENGSLRRVCAVPVEVQLDARDLATAEWATANARPAGRDTETVASSAWWFLPLVVKGGCLGAVALRFSPARGRIRDEQRRLAEAIVQQMALAADRAALAANLESARVEGETEQLRTALLASVADGLGSPLAATVAAATSLASCDATMTEETRRGLVDVVRREGERLDRYVQNLLDMTRLGAGPIKLRRDWVGLAEILDSALSGLRKLFPRLAVNVDMEPHLPALFVHGALIEQALFNILENAARFSPPGAAVSVTARRDGGQTLVLDIQDRGPGIAEEERRRLFGKAQGRADGARSTGLGLTIVRGMIGAHGGRVEAFAGEAGVGTTIRVTLPLAEHEAAKT